jgi:hypothetical protein
MSSNWGSTKSACGQRPPESDWSDFGGNMQRHAALLSMILGLAGCAAFHTRAETDDTDPANPTRSSGSQNAGTGGTILNSDSKLEGAASAKPSDTRGMLDAGDNDMATQADANSSPRQCQVHSRSSLPSVEIRFPRDANCEFSREEARAGAQIVYQIVVDQEVSGVGSYALGTNDCMIYGGSLGFYEELLTAGQDSRAYDHASCGEPEVFQNTGLTLYHGISTRGLPWYDADWGNPRSDAQNPGESLPAGTYRFSVRAQGRYGIQFDGVTTSAGTPFELESYVDIRLTD